MAIDWSGSWPRGDEAGDLDAILTWYTAEEYPVSRVEHVRCGACGHTVFSVRLDDNEGVAERTCSACSAVVLMLDSADALDEADLGEATCPCGGEQFEIAVGFALLDNGDVRWVYVALRCTSDGTMGVYVDWKIDYAPSTHLFTQV